MANKKETVNGEASDSRKKIKEEFEALPLDKKLASLFDMEVVALNDSISYVVNNSGEILNKVGDVISDFSCRVESEFKKATKANAAAAGAEEASKAGSKPEESKSDAESAADGETKA